MTNSFLKNAIIKSQCQPGFCTLHPVSEIFVTSGELVAYVLHKQKGAAEKSVGSQCPGLLPSNESGCVM